MRILAVDVGTGTQDVLLFDSEQQLENCVQMVLPSPTQVVAAHIRQATEARQPVVLVGTNMGGGPCAWAAEAHVRAGLPVYATRQAARTFDDDLDRVEQMGVRLLDEDQADSVTGAVRVELRDLYLDSILAAFAGLGVPTHLDALAVAVFDHGEAPADVSDRAFRFEYLTNTVTQNDLCAFAYLRDEIPPRMSRMCAVAQTAPDALPLLIMDTGPAAILGALEDPLAASAPAVIVNVGNLHTLAYHIGTGRIHGLFEHHTGEVTPEELESYLGKLARGTLTNAELFCDKGHGALVVSPNAPPPGRLVVLGPRRSLLEGSAPRPHFAVPHGAMMLAGCFGLLRAAGRKWPRWKNEIDRALGEQPTTEQR